MVDHRQNTIVSTTFIGGSIKPSTSSNDFGLILEYSLLKVVRGGVCTKMARSLKFVQHILRKVLGEKSADDRWALGSRMLSSNHNVSTSSTNPIGKSVGLLTSQPPNLRLGRLQSLLLSLDARWTRWKNSSCWRRFFLFNPGLNIEYWNIDRWPSDFEEGRDRLMARNEIKMRLVGAAQ